MGEADEEAVRVNVLLEVINFGLLVVAKISQTESPAGRVVPIDGDELAEVGGRDERNGYDVMIVVAPRKDFVVRLSVVGTEYKSYQRQLQLIARSEVLATDTEIVSRGGGRHDVYCDPSLSGVVARGHVVDKSQTGVGCGTKLYVEIFCWAQIEVSCYVEIVSAFEVSGIAAAVFGS